MKRILVIAGAVFAAILAVGITVAVSFAADDDSSAAGGSSSSSASSTTTAPAAYTWTTFKTDYKDFLTTTCEDKKGDPWISCIRWQVIQIDSITQAIKQLPPGRTRFDAESAITAFKTTYTKLNSEGCLNAGGMDELLCGLKGISANANVKTLQTYLNMGA